MKFVLTATRSKSSRTIVILHAAGQFLVKKIDRY